MKKCQQSYLDLYCHPVSLGHVTHIFFHTDTHFHNFIYGLNTYWGLSKSITLGHKVIIYRYIDCFKSSINQSLVSYVTAKQNSKQLPVCQGQNLKKNQNDLKIFLLFILKVVMKLQYQFVICSTKSLFYQNISELKLFCYINLYDIYTFMFFCLFILMLYYIFFLSFREVNAKHHSPGKISADYLACIV